jgi:hypothetical protein
MLKHCSVVALLTLCFASAGAWAGTALLVPVTINTSSIAGKTGSLDFNFNPGPLASQNASLEIVGFSADGTFEGAPNLIGDVSGGTLPTNVLFDNGTAFNDYFQDFTFGNELSFNLLLFGSAVTSPNGTSASGSAFAFSMFSDQAGTSPTLTSDLNNGFAFITNINRDGTLTTTDYSSETAIGAVSETPEPPPVLLLISGIAVIFIIVNFGRKPGLRSGQVSVHG